MGLGGLEKRILESNQRSIEGDEGCEGGDRSCKSLKLGGEL